MKKVTSSKLTGLIFALSIPMASALTLQDAIQETIETNPDILRDANDRLSRNFEIKQALAGYYPKIDVSAGIGTDRVDNPSTGFHDVENTLKEFRIRLEQMLFDGRLRKSEVERHMARVDSAAYRVYGTAEHTALRASEVYLEVLRRQELVNLAEKNHNAHARIFNQIRLRAESGVGSNADMQQAKGRLALAKSNLIAEETNLRDAKTNFLRVVGMLPGGDLIRPQQFSTMPASIEEATDISVQNNPVLMSAHYDVNAAEAQYRAAISPFYPKVYLEAFSEKNYNNDGRDGRDYRDYVGLQLRYNLFNGGEDINRRRQRAHQINEAKEIRNRTHRQVVESVRLAWNALSSIVTQLPYLQQHMAASKRTRDSYIKQFNIGQRSLLDLLDTENELFASSSAYVNADYDKLYAEYRVLAASGKLLSTLEVPLPEAAKPLGEKQAYNALAPRAPKFPEAVLEDDY